MHLFTGMGKYFIERFVRLTVKYLCMVRNVSLVYHIEEHYVYYMIDGVNVIQIKSAVLVATQITVI